MQSDRLDKFITEFPVGHLGTGTHFSGKRVTNTETRCCRTTIVIQGDLFESARENEPKGTGGLT